MHKRLKNKISLFIITLTLWSNAIFAQVTDPGGLDGGDPGNPAPIDNWIPIMLFVAIAFVFYWNSRNKVKA